MFQPTELDTAVFFFVFFLCISHY